MKRWGCAGAVTVAWIVGCGSAQPAAEVTGAASSAIQAGTTDSTHSFAVGVVQQSPSTNTVEFCSGSLLAPNLVATARHCVATISSPQIDCKTSTFGALVPASSLLVTIDTVITQHMAGFVAVAPGGIYVPSDAHVCGNDIALLVLAQSISLPGGYPNGYVVPAVNPPITDPSRSTTVAAIGYGIDTPTDDAGVTAGTRRIKENASLACIPNDPNFVDCFSDPNATNYLTAAEFVSADQTTCEGDSGSGVYDQAQFNAGKWVGYGVLSRGSVSADGQNCVSPIYTRFDAFGPLLSQAAAAAAARGGYALPSWASAVTVASDAGIALAPDAATSTPGSSGGSSGGTTSAGATIGADGTVCSTNVQCLSQNCVAYDGVHFYCASPCSASDNCATDFVCQGPPGGNYCFPVSSEPDGGQGSGSSGCSVAASVPTLRSGASSASDAPWLLAIVGVLVGARVRRRRAAPGAPAASNLSGS